MTPLERATAAAREEIVRQYREDERGKCPAGVNYYEEHVAPDLIARAVLEAIREPSEGMTVRMAEAVEAVTEIAAEADCKRPARLQALAAQAAFIDAALSEKPE